MLGVTVIVFLMMTPGDPAEIMLANQNASPEAVASLRHDMGLDRTLFARFVSFATNAMVGDFGMSLFHRRPVAPVIAERLPATIELSIAALLLALLVAIPLGVVAAVHRGGVVNRLATVGALFGVSLPRVLVRHPAADRLRSTIALAAGVGRDRLREPAAARYRLSSSSTA